ncbi:hypothetical protein K3495_g11251 [Podosphaera aphanis]|nr:hypothetical protein K3495_g11251 [Podosphaera aphanis]
MPSTLDQGNIDRISEKTVGISDESIPSIICVARLSGSIRSDLVASLCVPNVPLFRACKATTLWDLAILCVRIRVSCNRTLASSNSRVG